MQDVSGSELDMHDLCMLGLYMLALLQMLKFVFQKHHAA